MATNKTKFAKNLRRLRLNRGLSQSYVGDQTGISRHSIDQYENGIAEPSFIRLLKISRFFKVKIEKFLTEKLS